MEDRYASMRVRNDRGGYDLTADGWDEMVRIQERLVAATRDCAAALRKGGRLSVDFKTAHTAWRSVATQILELSGTARRFADSPAERR
jgi:hypothetical protein